MNPWGGHYSVHTSKVDRVYSTPCQLGKKKKKKEDPNSGADFLKLWYDTPMIIMGNHIKWSLCSRCSAILTPHERDS